MANDRVVARAVLAGSIIVAAAVYLGLQSRPSEPAQPTPSPPGPTTSALVTATAGEVGPRAVSPGAAQADVGAATRDAEAALAKARPGYRRSCYEGVAPPGTGTVRFEFRMTFDADGKELMRGINEQRETPQADVANCLRTIPLGLRIPAPGTTVTVSAFLELP